MRSECVTVSLNMSALCCCQSTIETFIFKDRKGYIDRLYILLYLRAPYHRAYHIHVYPYIIVFMYPVYPQYTPQTANVHFPIYPFYLDTLYLRQYVTHETVVIKHLHPSLGLVVVSSTTPLDWSGTHLNSKFRNSLDRITRASIYKETDTQYTLMSK